MWQWYVEPYVWPFETEWVLTSEFEIEPHFSHLPLYTNRDPSCEIMTAPESATACAMVVCLCWQCINGALNVISARDGSGSPAQDRANSTAQRAGDRRKPAQRR